jgi:hypothetical protein
MRSVRTLLDIVGVLDPQHNASLQPRDGLTLLTRTPSPVGDHVTLSTCSAPRGKGAHHVAALAVCADPFPYRASAARSSFGHHVSSVVLLGSKKEMVGVRAPGVVATMKHAQSRRDVAITERPRDSVRKSFSCLDVAQHSVSEVVVCAGPQPTPARWFGRNLREVVFPQWNMRRHGGILS